MRFALAIIAALANAAGPLLCCCAMAVVMGQPKAKADTQKSAAKCSHCKDEPGEKQKAPPATPKKDKSCPCQEHLASDPTTVQPVTETVTASDGISLDFNLLSGAVEVLPPPIAGPTQVVQGPFMTTETRLHAHHVLRC